MPSSGSGVSGVRQLNCGVNSTWGCSLKNLIPYRQTRRAFEEWSVRINVLAYACCLFGSKPCRHTFVPLIVSKLE